MTTREKYLSFKLVFIGDYNVGKSSILRQFADNTFTDTNMSTIGIDYKIRNIFVDNKLIRLEIWDTAGQERYKSIITKYYRDADGIIMIYDITNKRSFDNIRKWLPELEFNTKKEVDMILIGNKSDIEAKREVEYQNGKQMADLLNIEFMETSAKDNTNIDKIFINLITTIIKNQVIRLKAKSTQAKSIQDKSIQDKSTQTQLPNSSIRLEDGSSDTNKSNRYLCC